MYGCIFVDNIVFPMNVNIYGTTFHHSNVLDFLNIKSFHINSNTQDHSYITKIKYFALFPSFTLICFDLKGGESIEHYQGLYICI